jgi:hypothetical protein
VALLRSAALIAALAAASPAVAADESPHARFSLSKRAATIGDTLAYKMEVYHPEGARVLFPPHGKSVGDFDILHAKSFPDARGREGWRVAAQEWTLASYSTGVRAVPPTPVAVILADGDSVELSGDTLFVEVGGVLGEGGQALRDIKGPATVPGRSGWVKYAVGAAIAAALLLAIYLIRGRSRRWEFEAAPPHVAPHVAALQRLEALLGSRFLESGRFREFYTELSELFRLYLFQRFLIPAPEMTTRELAARLEYLGLPEDFRLEAGAVLEESDMVKFAKVEPGVEAALQAARRTETLVRAFAKEDGP